MVAVVGRLFQKWFPAQPNLSYTFIWDKTDAYGQRVYGLSEAVGEFASDSKAKQKITDILKCALVWPLVRFSVRLFQSLGATKVSSE